MWSSTCWPGADVVMTASALLRHGPEHVEVLLGGLVDWMTRKGFGMVRDMRGLLAVPASEDETAHERHGYVRVLQAAARTYRPW